jgi:hypothetical protein
MTNRPPGNSIAPAIDAKLGRRITGFQIDPFSLSVFEEKLEANGRSCGPIEF